MVNKRRTLLVTGASGFLGWNLCREAQAEWSVVGVIHSHAIEISGVQIVKADLMQPENVESLFAEVNPDAVIHAAALAQPDACEERPELSRRINVDAAETISCLCRRRGIPLAFISTDLVFDGRHPPYSEGDGVAPVNVYGRHKAEAESRVLREYPEAVVCRLPLMFGDPGPVAQNFLPSLVDAIARGSEVRLLTDEYRTPVDGASASRGVLLMLRQGLRGVVHLGGPERISRYSFGLIVARLLQANAQQIVAVRQKDMVRRATRPADVSLDSSKAKTYGYDPWPLEKALQQLVSVKR